MSLDVTTHPAATGRTDDAATFRAATTAATGDDPLIRSAAGRRAAAHAVSRDLDRLTRVLAEPVTSVRRAALSGHVAFLVDQIRLVDEDLAGRNAAALSRLRLAARRWSREPQQRLALLAAVEHVAGALSPTTDDAPAAPRSAGGSRSLRLWTRERPTQLAYRWFWMLDELGPLPTQALHRELTAPARWVLRNALSGGYNRRAYLMWFGGGTGPEL